MKPRHKKVDFNPEAWMAETSRMSRLVKSVYFDVCLYNWEHAKPMPEAEMMMVLQDLGDQGPAIVSMLMQTGKVLIVGDTGGYYVADALEAALRAADVFEKKSSGGKRGAAKTNVVGSDEGLSAGEADPPKVSPNDIYSNPHPNPPASGAIAPLPISGEIAETPEAAAAEQPVGEPDPETSEAEARAAAAKAGEARLAKAAKRSADTTTVVTAWNAMAAAAKLARIAKVTDERRRKIGARLDENTVDEMVEAINLIPARPFCMGGNDRGWKADIDFLLRPNTVPKLIEGTAYMGRGDDGGWASA